VRIFIPVPVWNRKVACPIQVSAGSLRLAWMKARSGATGSIGARGARAAASSVQLRMRAAQPSKKPSFGRW